MNGASADKNKTLHKIATAAIYCVFPISFNIAYFLMCGTNGPAIVWVLYLFIHLAYIVIAAAAFIEYVPDHLMYLPKVKSEFVCFIIVELCLLAFLIIAVAYEYVAIIVRGTAILIVAFAMLTVPDAIFVINYCCFGIMKRHALKSIQKEKDNA